MFRACMPLIALVVATVGCGSIPWEDRIYPGDCCDCVQTKGIFPITRRTIPQGACRGGCGDVYWGEWRSDPPDCCNPCNCGHCGSHAECGQCGDCAGCCARRSGPLSALTTRAVTGGHCDSPNCGMYGGCDYDPLPSRAVRRPGESRQYATRADFDQRRPKFSEYHARPKHMGTGRTPPGSAIAASPKPRPSPPGGSAVEPSPIDGMGWDLIGAESGPVEAPVAGRSEGRVHR